ncbi:MAG: hypothetical protein HY868_25590 [Chloroflexi bacterium]|nr:hypothetical protein [Chloroflexota bacterium]
MSIPFLSNIDLGKNELQNAVVQKLAVAPSSPVQGQVYYNTADNKTYQYNGSAWVSLSEQGVALTSSTPTAETVGATGNVGAGTLAARDDHRHAMPGLATAGVDGFMPGTDKTKLDNATAAATANMLMLRDASGRAQVATPSADADIANKSYVDSVAQGLDAKLSVLAVATSNVASLSGTTTIDGVALVASNRVLLTAQTTVSQNGIWVVQSGAWTRPTDFDSTADVHEGAFVFVEEGTSYEASGWVLSELAGTFPSNTTMTWAQFSGAGQIVAGNGLTKTGNTLDVSVDNSTIEINADALRVKALGITDSHVATANKDGAAGTASMRTLGTGAQQAAAGNHAHSGAAFKYAAALVGGATSEVVTHNLGSRDVIAKVYLVNSPYTEVECEIEHTSTTQITVKMASAIAAGTYRVVVVG